MGQHDSVQLFLQMVHHFNKGGNIENFPDVVPLRSLDDIHDCATLVTLPGISTLYIVRDVKVEMRLKDLVVLNCSEGYKADELRYDFGTGKVFGLSIPMITKSGIGLIPQEFIDKRAAYIAG
jgi:hypothetical protein